MTSLLEEWQQMDVESMSPKKQLGKIQYIRRMVVTRWMVQAVQKDNEQDNRGAASDEGPNLAKGSLYYTKVTPAEADIKINKGLGPKSQFLRWKYAQLLLWVTDLVR